MVSEEHDSAVQRLEAALGEQHRLLQRYDAAVGTASELGAYAQLRAAGDQVAARQAWLYWIDDERYRGLNAGPFELLTESRAARWNRESEGEDHDQDGATPRGNRARTAEGRDAPRRWRP